MKTRSLLLTLALSLALFATAQSRIAVQNEEYNSQETSALVYAEQNAAMKDPNGRRCALVIVHNPDGEPYLFDAGNVYLRAEKKKTSKGEDVIYLAVADGLKRLDIRHADGSIPSLTYVFNNGPLNGGNTYHLYMAPMEAQSGRQFLRFQLDPPEALLEVEEAPGEFVPWTVDAEGKASKALPMGNYKYTVQCRDYHSTAGVVELKSRNNSVVEKVSLRPNFGSVRLKGEDLTGAELYLDGERFTPTALARQHISSGKHTLKITKPKYKLFQKNFTVKDGQPVDVEVRMDPNFATVSLSAADPAVLLYLRNPDGDQLLGKGTVTADLEPGKYVLVARCAGYKEATLPFTVDRNLKKDYRFTAPALKAQYGSLSVRSNVDGAEIFIDGRRAGVTPAVINSLLATEHSIEVRMPGRNPYEGSFTITPDGNTELYADINERKRITLSGNAASYYVYIDGQYATPLRSANGTAVYEAAPGAKMQITALGDFNCENVSRNITVRDNETITLHCPERAIASNNKSKWGWFVNLGIGWEYNMCGGSLPFAGTAGIGLYKNNWSFEYDLIIGGLKTEYYHKYTGEDIYYGDMIPMYMALKANYGFSFNKYFSIRLGTGLAYHYYLNTIWGDHYYTGITEFEKTSNKIVSLIGSARVDWKACKYFNIFATADLWTGRLFPLDEYFNTWEPERSTFYGGISISTDNFRNWR